MVDQAEIHRMARSEDANKQRDAAEQLRNNFIDFIDKKQAWEDLIRLTFDTDSEVQWDAADALGSAFVYVPNKKQAWEDLIRLTFDTDSDVQWHAADALGRVFANVPDKKQAWEELHRHTFNTNSIMRWLGAAVLGRVFEHVPDKKQAWEDLIRLTFDTDSEVHRCAADALGRAFTNVPDKKQAWEDLHRLTSSTDSEVRWDAAIAVRIAFGHVPNKKQAWEDLIRLTFDTDSDVQWHAADAVGRVFAHVPDKKQAWEDLHRLTFDTNSIMRWHSASVLGRAFAHVPDKKQAWEDLHRLTFDTDSEVQWRSASALGSAFAHVPDKKQAWEDLIRLTSDKNIDVHRCAADALGKAFAHVPDKKQAWEDLIRLTSNTDSFVRASAYNSIGKASIFKAVKTENDADFKKEMEAAIGYFEKSSQQDTWSEPSNFCLPFYRSFYTLTFKKEEAEAEVQKYLSEAESAVQDSKSKEKLLDAVKNLGNALKEAQKMQDFNAVKSDLNAYRRYCERACELLDTTEENAPGASMLIRKGMTIIDEKIKRIIGEIKKRAVLACQQSKGTPVEEIACAANREIQKWHINDQEEMTWAVDNLIFSLSLKIPHNPENIQIHEKIEKIRKEENIEEQYNMIANLIALIPSVIVHTGDTINVSGSQNRVYKNSIDKSINIIGDLQTDLEKLRELVEKDYKEKDKNELIQIVDQMKQNCNDLSKKKWLKEKLGWILTKTSEVSSISSLVITLLQNHFLVV